MQSKNKFFEDMSKLMSGAADVAYQAKDEAETAFNSYLDRWVAQRNLVPREEFEAVRLMAKTALEMNETLSERVRNLEEELERICQPNAACCKEDDPSVPSRDSEESPST